MTFLGIRILYDGKHVAGTGMAITGLQDYLSCVADALMMIVETWQMAMRVETTRLVGRLD